MVGAGLLASAFAPVVALVAVLRLPELGIAGWIVLAACLAAVGFLALVLRGVRALQTRTVHTRMVRHADEKVLAFTASYVVPVVVAAFAGGSTSALAATGGLVLLLALVYVRAGLFHLNPLLAVFGYRLYELTATNEAVTMLLTRARHLPQSGEVPCRYLGDMVAIQLGEPDGR